MFPEPTELLLIGCSIESNFTRDEWNHLVCLFNISHFSSTDCSGVMSKRTQEDAGEERITAKSKPMMNLVSRCSVRDPNVLASTASESLVKTRHENQSSLSPQTEKYDRTENPLYLRTRRATQNETLIKLGLLKSGNLMKCWKQERGDPWVGNQQVRSPCTQTDLSLMMMIWTLTPP